MLILLGGPDLGGGGGVLEHGARPGPAFTLFTTSFFDTTTFHFLIAACEASEPGRGGERTTLPFAQELNSNNRRSGYSSILGHHVLLARSSPTPS
jgi:hypothetical protein